MYHEMSCMCGSYHVLRSSSYNRALCMSFCCRCRTLYHGTTARRTESYHVSLLYSSIFIPTPLYYYLRLSRKLGPRMIRHSLLIPDKIHTLMSHGSLSPALEPGCLFLQLRSQLGALQAMLGFTEGKNPEEERSAQNLPTC